MSPGGASNGTAGTMELLCSGKLDLYRENKHAPSAPASLVCEKVDSAFLTSDLSRGVQDLLFWVGQLAA